MRTLIVAAAILLSTTMGAAANGGSTQASTDLSGAVGDSVAKGSALAAISVAAPVLSVGVPVTGSAMSAAAAGSRTICARTAGCRSLPVTEKTIIRGPAPDDALAARQPQD